MTAQTILPANSVTGGFEVANSLRFNRASTDNLSRTKGTSDSTTTGTYSFWFKLSKTTGLTLIENGTAAADRAIVYIDSNSKLKIFSKIGNSTKLDLGTNRVFRDTSAWYHLVIAIDTTDGTAGDRVKVYVNGVRETSFATATYPDQNDALRFFTSSEIEEIGIDFENGGLFDGYMCEVVKVDGSQLAPTSFGEFDEDSGIWKPINVSGLTFGTNGFHLNFQDSSNLGNDANGGTDFTENNLTAVDQSTDTCTNNFATLNPLDVFDDDGRTLSNGNLDFTTSSGNNGNISGTLAVSGSGKWYFETKISAQSGTASSSAKFGIVGIRDLNKSTPDSAGNAYYIYSDGRKEDGANTTNSAHPGYVLNDIVQVALDLDNGNVYFGLNGDWGDNDGNFDEAFADATAFFGSINTNGFWTIYLNKNVTADNVLTLSANFGSPSFAISSGNADGDGFGNFEFAVPSGYFALCTKNLAEYGG